jgi:hypothetical protein
MYLYIAVIVLPACNLPTTGFTRPGIKCSVHMSRMSILFFLLSPFYFYFLIPLKLKLNTRYVIFQ